MTTIDSGYVPPNPSNKPTTDGGASRKLSDHHTIHAATQEELDNFLNRVSLELGIPVDELTINDITQVTKLAKGVDIKLVKDPETGKMVYQYTLKPNVIGETQGLNDSEFFGDEIPSYPSGSGPYLGSKVDLGKPGPFLDSQLAGLAGAANAIYNANYGDEPLAPIDPAQLDPEVLKLLKNLFGENTQFNQGHMNVLKVMGLAEGSAQSSASSWTLSERGGHLSKAFTSNPGATNYIPSMNLLSLSSDILTQADAAKGYFTADGFAHKYGTADVEKTAQTVFKAMGKGKETLPPGTIVTDDARELIIRLLGLPADTTELTPAQINTATSMGLLTFDPATQTVSVTQNGGIYLQAKRAADNAGTPPPDGNKPPDTPTDLKSFWEAMNLFKNLKGEKGADMYEYLQKAAKHGDNGRFGTNGMGALANASPEDNKFWSDIGLGNLTNQERQQLINAAKILMDPRNKHFLDQVHKGDGIFEKNDITDWLNANNNTWLAGEDAAKAQFSDPNFAPPNNFNYLRGGLNNLNVSQATKDKLEAECKRLFGKGFSEMTHDEQRKALYILTNTHDLFNYTPAENVSTGRGSRIEKGSLS